MSLKLIGAGFGRTGTMSLKLALEQLGFGPCHHMIEVLRSSPQIAFWEAAAQGNPPPWDTALAHYRSAVDWPSGHYWRKLAEAYPDAKIILTVRSPESWWASFSATILQILQQRDSIPDPEMRRTMAMAHKIIIEQTLGGKTDEAAALAAFAHRIAEVKAAIPAERLLVFDVREGWEPLTNFLGCATPEGPFPRSNSREEFWEHTRG